MIEMVFSIIVALSLQAQVLDRCAIPGLLPAASRVVFLDSESSTAAAEAVVVDQDGSILNLIVGPEVCQLQATLGSEVKLSGDLPVERWIDHGEVVVEARRMTTQNGVLHFLVTYGIMPDALKWKRTYYSLSSYVCYLYVLRKEGHQVRRLLKADEGFDLVDFELADVDGDGWRDAVIRTRTRPQGNDVSVVRVEGGTGQVTRLQVPEGCDEWWQRSGAVVLGRQVKRPSEGSAVISDHEEYRWDQEIGEFIRIGKWVRQCRYLKSE